MAARQRRSPAKDAPAPSWTGCLERIESQARWPERSGIPEGGASMTTLTISPPQVRTMAATIITAPGKIELDDVPLPSPKANEVRVKLQGCGVCASNIPPWEGREWFKYPMAPGALGHEGWGIVDAVGSDVRAVKEGDRVAMLSDHAYAQFDVAGGGGGAGISAFFVGGGCPGGPVGG